MEVEKQIREIIEFYCGGTYENRVAATQKILQIYQNLQLQQTGVKQSVCNYCLEWVDELPDKFGCKECIEKHK